MIGLLFITQAALPHAIDAGWQGQDTCERLQETDALLAFKCTFPPGVGHERHFHRAHIGYVVEGGRMQITDDKGTLEQVIPAGVSWQSAGVPWHVAVNIGETATSYVIVEPKTHSSEPNPATKDQSAVAVKDSAPTTPPYSPVIEANGVIYLAGHLGRDPQSRALPTGIMAQTRQTLENIGATLASVNATHADIVRCQVFLADIGNFDAMNTEYRKFFPGRPPARTTVAVAGLALDAEIEIECTAVRGHGQTMETN